MNVLGIWDGHDSGAAVIADGRLVAAANEERFTRRKLEIRFPARSIGACLEIARLTGRDVDLVAASTSDLAKTLARWFPALKEDYHRIRRRTDRPGRFVALRKCAKYWLTEWGSNALLRTLSARALERELSQVGVRGAALRLFEHHAAHAMAAGWASGYSTCAVVTMDGVGDGLSSTISTFADGAIHPIAESRARNSVGVFFEHVTNLLNMRELEDEGKVMALADHATPVPDERNPLFPFFSVRDGRIQASVPGHAMMRPLRSVQWHWPNEQFAYMAQRVLEAVTVQLVRDAVRLTGCRRVALAGGVASNVKANRRMRMLDEVEDLYVFPHMGDGGLAVGAALLGARENGGMASHGLADLALGPEFSDEQIVESIERAGLCARQPIDLANCVADLLARDRVVLWFQGRMEYGPRALGCRSVLARPDSVALRDRLNLVLKQRVWYQPFCPSLLESEAPHVLEDYTTPTNRHMTMAYAVRSSYRDALAGVTSVDGSCRPQIVSDEDPGPFTAVLRAFKARTGLGVLLNTSFNIHGEPLVCTPAEAIDVYSRTGADAIALGSRLVIRQAAGAAAPTTATRR
jgi:carbamoyltransferase